MYFILKKRRETVGSFIEGMFPIHIEDECHIDQTSVYITAYIIIY